MSRRKEGMKEWPKIIDYWKSSPVSHLINWTGDVKNKRGKSCMACGSGGGTYYSIDRAHILDYCSAGSGKPSNTLLLCRLCHGNTSAQSYLAHWAYVVACSRVYDRGTDMPYEIDFKPKKGKLYDFDFDCAPEDALQRYPMQCELLDKHKEYEKEYMIISALKQGGHGEGFSYGNMMGLHWLNHYLKVSNEDIYYLLCLTEEEDWSQDICNDDLTHAILRFETMTDYIIPHRNIREDFDQLDFMGKAMFHTPKAILSNQIKEWEDDLKVLDKKDEMYQETKTKLMGMKENMKKIEPLWKKYGLDIEVKI